MLEKGCDVYWGSHGCMLLQGHEGRCICECAIDEAGKRLPHMDDDVQGDENNGNVGCWPYYGPGTRFYGDDVKARGLPYIKDSIDA